MTERGQLPVSKNQASQSLDLERKEQTAVIVRSGHHAAGISQPGGNRVN